MPTARRVLLVSRPEKEIKLENFRFDEQELPQLQDGEILVKLIYLSVDPYMRGKMRDVKSYTEPFQLDQPLYGGGVGEVVESKNPKFKVGDIVNGNFKWQTYAVVPASELGWVRTLPSTIPPSYSLSVVGMPGLTAYFGLLDICDPKEKDTVVVSGGAGAVGSIVGQIAKIKKCKNVVGIAGSEDKCQFMKDLGFDHVINYKNGNLEAQLDKVCPEGVDVYFDNVGGEITDTVISKMNVGGRVSCCGAISQYNERSLGPRHEWAIISKGLKIQGFIVAREFMSKWGEGLQQLGAWVKEGKLKISETTLEGIDNLPQALIDVMSGKNTGKQLVKL